MSRYMVMCVLQILNIRYLGSVVHWDRPFESALIAAGSKHGKECTAFGGMSCIQPFKRLTVTLLLLVQKLYSAACVPLR